MEEDKTTSEIEEFKGFELIVNYGTIKKGQVAIVDAEDVEKVRYNICSYKITF